MSTKNHSRAVQGDFELLWVKLTMFVRSVAGPIWLSITGARVVAARLFGPIDGNLNAETGDLRPISSHRFLLLGVVSGHSPSRETLSGLRPCSIKASGSVQQV